MTTSFIEMIEVSWECPTPGCNTKNLDDFARTAEPFCEKCENTFSWDELLSDEEMARHNQSLQAIEAAT